MALNLDFHKATVRDPSSGKYKEKQRANKGGILILFEVQDLFTSTIYIFI